MSAVDDYLKQVPPRQRAELKRIRNLVRQLVPDAEEGLSYGMPAFKYHKKPLLYYGAFKHHMSIFPTGSGTQALSPVLATFKTSKGTLQFTEDKPIPETALRQLIADRLKAIS